VLRKRTREYPEITKVASDTGGEEPKDPVYLSMDIPQAITAYETQDNAGIHTSVNRLAGSINPPFVSRPQGQPDTSTNNGVAFGSQGINPEMSRPSYPPPRWATAVCSLLLNLWYDTLILPRWIREYIGLQPTCTQADKFSDGNANNSI